MRTFFVVLMFVVLVAVHEGAHYVTAMLQGKKLKKFYFGIPLKGKLWGKERSTVLFSWNWHGIEFGVSWLILGGMVDFEDFESSLWITKVTTYLAGPLSNLLIAAVPLLWYFGPQTTWYVVSAVTTATFQAMGWLAAGEISLSTLPGPVGAVIMLSSMTQTYGYLFVWMILNVSIMAYNLLPLPALDGGQVLVATIVSLVGEKAKKPAEVVGKISFYFVLLIVLVSMTMDLW